MAAYCLVYDLRHLQADCQEPGSAPEPYARQSSMGYLYLFTSGFVNDVWLPIMVTQMRRIPKVTHQGQH